MTFSFSHLIKILSLSSLLLLAACGSNLSAPASQLQGLSSSAAQVLHDGGQLRVVVLVDNAFKPRTSRLTPGMQQILAKVTKTLQNYPDLKIKVVGYTDNRGNPKKNQLITLRRAMAVADYFRDHGISSARISFAGMGSADPIASNDTAQGRMKNRRVELLLS